MQYKQNSVATSSSIVPALVLKNDIYARSVIILHKYVGKIRCSYAKNKQGQTLCTGSLFFCSLQKKGRIYHLEYIQLHFVPMQATLESLQFIHDIVRICLVLLPDQAPVLELFDFIWYVYQQIYELSDKGKMISLLRIFLLFDLLPESPNVYRYAQQDPYDILTHSKEELDSCLQICWKRFQQQAS